MLRQFAVLLVVLILEVWRQYRSVRVPAVRSEQRERSGGSAAGHCFRRVLCPNSKIKPKAARSRSPSTGAGCVVWLVFSSPYVKAPLLPRSADGVRESSCSQTRSLDVEPVASEMNKVGMILEAAKRRPDSETSSGSGEIESEAQRTEFDGKSTKQFGNYGQKYSRK
ncbi:hypothetical protein BDZ89DRAFT_1072338 [Hymenopellis radicata]|nr:hypothetical protein BDZ89DRAFT_1072338 [Hymenopellis radicata]